MKQRHWIFLWVIVFLAPDVHARRYKYSLDPARAEEILSGISLNQPMAEERWLGLLGPKRDERYTVQQGDNLWTISQRTFGDPFLWRKLWAMNPDFANPHELEVGQVLAYYRQGLPNSGFEIPLIKLLPNKIGAATDLDSDAVINPEIKNQFRPSFWVVDEKEFLGEVTGSYDKRKWLTQHSEIYAAFDDIKKVEKDQAYAVVRVDRRVYDRTSPGSPLLGTLVRLVGEVKTLQNIDELTKLELIQQSELVARGDKLIPARGAIKPVAVFNPPETLVARIVDGENPAAEFFGQGQVVLLNKGVSEGMKDGYLFRATVDTDPLLRSRSEVRPAYKGEVQVISAGELASVGLILRNNTPLVEGDVLIAAQLFPDPPPQPHRVSKEIELD